MKILLAYDGSPHSERALESLKWFVGSASEILVIKVLNGMALDAEGEPIEPDPDELAATNRLLSDASACIRAATGIAVRTEVLVGDPTTAIPRKAEAESTSLIVTGSHGFGFVERLKFGSVSSAVMNKAHCAVMVVK